MTSTPVKKIATVLGAGSLLLGAVVAAPAATAPAASTPTAGPDASGPTAGLRTSLVAAWYQQFLGRSAADDPGSKYWVVRLRTEAPEQVLADLLRSPEYVGAQIEGYYQDYLGRSTEGDPAADHWFSGVYDKTFPLEWVEQSILGSTEYVIRSVPAGSDAYRTVQSWYGAILGRQAGAGEVDYWATRLETASPLQVVREIWYAPEAVNHRIAVHYEVLLHRTAEDPGGSSYWYPFEVASDDATRIAIASSQEYQTNALTRG